MPRTVESLIKENERLSESSEWNATGLDDQRRRKDRSSASCRVRTGGSIARLRTSAEGSPASEDIMHESAEKAIVRAPEPDIWQQTSSDEEFRPYRSSTKTRNRARGPSETPPESDSEIPRLISLARRSRASSSVPNCRASVYGPEGDNDLTSRWNPGIDFMLFT
ncbi:uncharacterized protein BT62DRAFT_1006427 [Guyanagaster necrorhizus]|uniref:Uncharacterized protein n=1 Tax=Guyanagaster necrorhizus TaxID=856835 RepID=A0A9P7VQD1_9AGAR|nr:uncharacterized protein BT62DRAFT_1006427 [Guyanagaster necrorhizus MCA 3950]KAG7445483.1 hypothetical protein BT62DRAFT_1006427 [Guyanagaster necrorhizus MCA 3950]